MSCSFLKLRQAPALETDLGMLRLREFIRTRCAQHDKFIEERLSGIIKPMPGRRLIFAFFAMAILFSMVREWNAPAACARTILVLSTSALVRR